jgi:hypothetical protein
MEEEGTSNAKEEAKGPTPAARQAKRKPLAFLQSGNSNIKVARHNISPKGAANS